MSEPQHAASLDAQRTAHSAGGTRRRTRGRDTLAWYVISDPNSAGERVRSQPKARHHRPHPHPAKPPPTHPPPLRLAAISVGLNKHMATGTTISWLTLLVLADGKTRIPR